MEKIQHSHVQVRGLKLHVAQINVTGMYDPYSYIICFDITSSDFSTFLLSMIDNREEKGMDFC